MPVYTIHGTKKLLDRVKYPVMPAVEDPTTALGNWYATAIFWRPQVAFLVNEATLFPVLLPLAPAASIAARFPDALESILKAVRPLKCPLVVLLLVGSKYESQCQSP